MSQSDGSPYFSSTINSMQSFHAETKPSQTKTTREEQTSNLFSSTVNGTVGEAFIMGANKQQKKSSFSLFNMFKARGLRRSEDTWDDTTAKTSRKIWPSDEDRGSWVADPRINSKATDFILNFHATRVSASELHAHDQINCQATKA